MVVQQVVQSQTVSKVEFKDGIDKLEKRMDKLEGKLEDGIGKIEKGMDKLEGRLFISFTIIAAILAYIALK